MLEFLSNIKEVIMPIVIGVSMAIVVFIDTMYVAILLLKYFKFGEKKRSEN